jgi:hypothetical protein
VLEGYIDTSNLVSEEDSGQDGVKGMMPEAGGYMGRAWKVWEFNVTAITHRKDYLYWFPLAVNADTTNLMAMPAEASVFDACRASGGFMQRSCSMMFEATSYRPQACDECCRTTWLRCPRTRTSAGSSRSTTTSTSRMPMTSCGQ